MRTGFAAVGLAVLLAVLPAGCKKKRPPADDEVEEVEETDAEYRARMKAEAAAKKGKGNVKIGIGIGVTRPTRRPPAGGVLLRDTFTATDGTDLTAHTMDTGGGWTVRTGGYTIVGGRAKAAGASHADADAGASDVTISATLPCVVGDFAGFAVRVATQSDRWEVYVGALGLEIVENVGGARNSRAAATVAGLIPGAVYTLTVEAVGQTILASYGGVTCQYGFASAHRTETRHGLVCFGSPAAGSWDDFTVTAR